MFYPYREITFENAEELTEEGLPFLILFHAPDDVQSIKDYKTIVETQLITEKREKDLNYRIDIFFLLFKFSSENINFLTADGKKFAHPLHHLGKSASDLPLLAIDSFRHMYLFPRFKDMYTPGKLKEFLNDLYSGKLHRLVNAFTVISQQNKNHFIFSEFHYGPESPSEDTANEVVSKSLPPPESAFQKLAPSNKRYTLLRDEL